MLPAQFTVIFCVALEGLASEPLTNFAVLDAARFVAVTVLKEVNNSFAVKFRVIVFEAPGLTGPSLL